MKELRQQNDALQQRQSESDEVWRRRLREELQALKTQHKQTQANLQQQLQHVNEQCSAKDREVQRLTQSETELNQQIKKLKACAYVHTQHLPVVSSP